MSSYVWVRSTQPHAGSVHLIKTSAFSWRTWITTAIMELRDKQTSNPRSWQLTAMVFALLPRVAMLPRILLPISPDSDSSTTSSPQTP